MNSRKTFVTLFMFCVCAQASCQTSESMITAIEQRRYMIKRLEKTIATLAEAHQKRIPNHLAATRYFRNPLVRGAFVAMEHTQSVVPFYMLWSRFLAYQFIDNKEFIKEILTAILLLYKDLILSLQKTYACDEQLLLSIDAHIQKTHDDSARDVLPLLDTAQTAHEYYKATCISQDCYELNKILIWPHTLQPFYDDASSHSVEATIGTIHHLLDEEGVHNISVYNTMRFYHIQRLLKSMFILSHKKGVIEFTFDDAIINSLTCPSIQACARALVAQKNVVPLFSVWSAITTYDFINDINHVREFVLITCLAYQQITNVLVNESDTKAVHAQDVLAMYEKLATLPVAQLLDLLDDVVEQYDTLAQQYALKDSSLTWKQWFEKYWWSAPIMLSSFAATLLKHAKVLLFSANTTQCFKK